MKKNFLWSLLMAMCAVFSVTAADYGMPATIQQGNILHCFNWPITTVKAELPQIAAAGFGSVQLSPLQRPDIKTGHTWHDLYRPYDLAFKASPFMGSEQDLRDLCAEAATYGIKVIVDVVANHVDRSSGYHDTWWDSDGRKRDNVPQSIDYNNRWQVTHHKLGDYYEINSEHADVIAKGKAYVEFLKGCGVKGVRWDAAKHIGLPSEGCGFWSAVTSVPGMWHYGEILDKPYNGDDGTLIKEYASMMSVTDNNYSNGAARGNGGIPYGFGGDWAGKVGDNKCVYWGESHDTYSNDEWSQNVDQSVIDRAYAAVACRNEATALYLARPTVKGFNNIKVGKGTDAYRGKAVAEVNKFRNVMVNKADWFESGGNACSVTRKDGGAVIVMKGSGNVSVANGGGYCPAGTYTDRVSGGTFTVTSTTISGNVGSSGIAVIYNDGTQPSPDPDPDPEPDPVDGKLFILGNLEGAAGWGTTPGTGLEMTDADGKYTATAVTLTTTAADGICYFSFADAVYSNWTDLNAKATRYAPGTDSNKAATPGTAMSILKYNNNGDCKAWSLPAGTYNFSVDLKAMTMTVTQTTVEPQKPVYVYYDGNWGAPSLYVYDAAGKWYKPWDEAEAMTRDEKTGYFRYELPEAYRNSSVIFKNGTDQYPAANQPGLAVEGKSMIFRHGTNTWEEYTEAYTPTAVGEVVSASVGVVSRPGSIVVSGLEGETLVVAGIDGRLYHSGAVHGAVEVNVAPGIYVVSVAGHASRLLVR